MGKYKVLGDYFRDLDSDRKEFTFKEIETILNFSLPPSARKRRAWWANSITSHVQAAEGWLSNGWKVESVDIVNETVRFLRTRKNVLKISIDIANYLEKEMDKIINKNNWSLSKKINQGFVAYKIRGLKILEIHRGYWITKDCWIGLKLNDKPKEKQYPVLNDYEYRWIEKRKRLYLKIPNASIKVKSLESLFELAYTDFLNIVK